MLKKNLLSKAIKISLLTSSSLGILATAPIAMAADSADEVERIEVTGSRIKRTDLEGASPVTVITTEDMKIEGNFTVADALRNSTFNSFGSFSERSGSSAQSQATINLRGAGAARTLVLLDGKRFPGSPTIGSGAANLNAIPMAAVERVEILTDGASSTYGSDAIAGVVNVILKKNYEGLEFNLGAGHRDQDKGTTSKEFSILGGMSTDKGNITFSFDHQSRKGISDGARDYTKAKAEDLDGDGHIEIYTEETTGYSYYGANIQNPDGSGAITASPLCDDLINQYGGDTFTKMSGNAAFAPGSTVCAYAFANVSYNTASVDRNTVFVDANYEVADGVEWFGRAMFVANKSFGRYAPPAAGWNNMAADNPHNPYDEEVNGYFRWVGIGTRDGNIYDYNQDYLTGLRGELDWNNATWEVYYHTNITDNKSVGQYYLSYGGLAINEANGIDLGSEEGIDNLKATTLQESTGQMDQFYAGIGFDMFELPGGTVAHYFGAEYMEMQYADIYDAQSEAGNVGGSAGNSAQGTREITAVFYEAALPVTDDIEMNIAARYDDYSDFGDNLAPKVSIRWQAHEDVVIRASYSEAFRAPALSNLYQATSFDARNAYDYKQCAANGISNANCPQRQFNNFRKANPNLGPESSEYLNFGVAWDISDNMGLKIDLFDLTIDDVIQQKLVQDVLSDEAAGRITAVPEGTDVSDETFYLIRSASGNLLEVGSGFTNDASFSIRGLDINWNTNWETSFGDFRFNLQNSFVLEYEEEKGGELFDTSGWSTQPDHKGGATLTWSMDDHAITWNTAYTASTSESEITSGKDVTIDGKLDSWVIHNLTYSYHAGDYGTVSFSVSNLTDEDPVLSSNGSWDDQNNYNNFGRDYRVAYKINF